ncbi:MAG: hypothetical protein KVP17_002909 [Porospora cf. gigantea B]|uniref:uncharacterized protein n=1 Tax=Porospora cf. gigantea B TaxID=2853592 RepID=UPI003571C13F|nr:MAG: hypothetical protein KVP17_002909 [Porospora cf. gigantea B]
MDLPVRSSSSPTVTPVRRPPPSISSPLQFLTLTQGNREYYGLVDTGSQINLIDVDLVATLRHEEVLPTAEGTTEFRGITGGNTPILGWAILTLCLPTGEAITASYALVSRYWGCLSSTRGIFHTLPPRGSSVHPRVSCA